MRSSWVCLDAGVLVRVVAFPDYTAAQTLWQQWIREERQVIAPDLLLYEVTNALYQYQKRGMMTAQAVSASLGAALVLPIKLFGDAQLHRAALDIARRYALSATYDAHYVALAERYDAELWTTDQRLVNRCQKNWIKLVGEEAAT